MKQDEAWVRDAGEPWKWLDSRAGFGNCGSAQTSHWLKFRSILGLCTTVGQFLNIQTHTLLCVGSLRLFASVKLQSRTLSVFMGKKNTRHERGSHPLKW